MNELLEIIKITIPPTVVALVVYFVVKRFVDRQDRISMLRMKTENQRLVSPIRLQAYERVVLLLERIAPAALVMRENQPQMSAKQLHADILKSIRNEFNHNVTQQVYISDRAWNAVLNAKEETIKLVNLAAAQCADDATALDLSKAILDLSTKVQLLPTQAATMLVKEEARQMF
jgi:hypothetical protein